MTMLPWQPFNVVRCIFAYTPHQKFNMFIYIYIYKLYTYIHHYLYTSVDADGTNICCLLISGAKYICIIR